MFTVLDISCPLIPENVDVTVVEEFCDWLSLDPGDYKEYPFHNGLKLFLWIIDHYGNLYD